LSRLERVSQELVRKWLDQYRRSINELPEARMQRYNEVRGLATRPEPIPIVYTQSIEVRKGETSLPKHLYADERGLFSVDLNSWESTVITEEIAKPNVVGWIRNFDRKSWSLAVPYEQGGIYRAMYPDFLVVRRTPDGLVADLLDPHQLDLADAPAKAAGLAKYAAENTPVRSHRAHRRRRRSD